MNVVLRIAKNTLVLLCTQVVSYIISFVYMLGMARYLSPASFGILSFAIAFTTIISVLGDLGLQWYATRDLSRDMTKAPQYLANLIPVKIILAALSYGLIVAIVFLTGLPRQTALTVNFIGISVVLNIGSFSFQVGKVYCQKEERRRT